MRSTSNEVQNVHRTSTAAEIQQCLELNKRENRIRLWQLLISKGFFEDSFEERRELIEVSFDDSCKVATTGRFIWLSALGTICQWNSAQPQWPNLSVHKILT